MIEIKPQPGPQTEFLISPADIAIYGGGAGSGKSFSLLIEPIRHFDNPKFGAVIFRRTTPEIRNEGGLWDGAQELYPPLGAELKETTLEVNFPTGMRVKFAHLEYEKDVLSWQGAQIPFIGFDELTHFTEKQFFYMLSRNRSTSGVPAYIRATCNPDSKSWVKHFIQWWIDPKTGFPIPERSGKLRWFIRVKDEMHWADSKEEIFKQFGTGPEIQPKSVTFISAKLQDNKILMEKDPGYLANLLALPMVERARLLDGNWNIEIKAGMLFKREWFRTIEAIPLAEVKRSIRAWDKAATKPTPANPDPDWTRGLKMHKLKDGRFVIAHVASTRDTPLQVETLVKNTASQDSIQTEISIAQDPGSAGVADRDNFTRLLAGYVIKINKPSSDKITRAKALSAQCEAGNVLLLRGPWNEDFLSEAENFPDGAHDDQIDAASDAFNELVSGAIGDFTDKMVQREAPPLLEPTELRW